MSSSNTRGMPQPGETVVLSPEERQIAKWLRSVTFKKRRFGGVDEADVWRKIEELNSLYEKALIAERARTDKNSGASLKVLEDMREEHE